MQYVAKKATRGSRSFRFITSDYCGYSRLARFPKSESREIRGPQNHLPKTEYPARTNTRHVASKDIHSTEGLEWIKATERGW